MLSLKLKVGIFIKVKKTDLGKSTQYLKKKLFSASESHASSSAQTSSEPHAISSTGGPLFDWGWSPHNDEYVHETCQAVNFCGIGDLCAKMKCDACKTLPFVPIYGCACPKDELRLRDGKCVPAKSYECKREADHTSEEECQVAAPLKPCKCPENEMCSTQGRLCGDECRIIKCEECDSNPNKGRPHCLCKDGYARLHNGICVPADSRDCQAEASIDECKHVELITAQPCQCNY